MANWTNTVLALSTLSGYWKLNETSGTTADDAKNTLDGTYIGSPTLNNTGVPFVDDAVTSLTPAFDGTNNKLVKILTTPQTSSGNYNFTFGCWMKSAADTEQYALSVTADSVSRVHSIGMYTNGRIQIYSSSSTNLNRLHTTADYDINNTDFSPAVKWHFIIGTFNHQGGVTTNKLYVNATEIVDGVNGTRTNSNNISMDGVNRKIVIGLKEHGASPTYSFRVSGNVCEAFWCTSVLTQGDITALYNAAITEAPSEGGINQQSLISNLLYNNDSLGLGF